MLIIPAINCPDSECIKERLKKAAEFSNWVQIDIADGKFTEHKTWDKPEELLGFRIQNPEFRTNIEVHLMVENPEEIIDDWVKAGAQRVIAHLEAIEDLRLKNKNLRDCELGLAINPETPVEDLIPWVSVNLRKVSVNQRIGFIQLLAVPPGKSGQEFDTRVLDKIKFLKKNYPDVIIEVDGGINLETARMCKEAGADILAAGSFIWESVNSREAYRKLFLV